MNIPITIRVVETRGPGGAWLLRLGISSSKKGKEKLFQEKVGASTPPARAIDSLAFVMLSLHFRILYVNEAARNALGKSTMGVSYAGVAQPRQQKSHAVFLDHKSRLDIESGRMKYYKYATIVV